jgi:AcrR family transcriptional regulator
MSRPCKYTPEQVAQALTDCHGKVYLAAERLGCSARTVYTYLSEHACVQEAAEQAQGRFLDVLEVKLHERALAGDLAAIKYTLSSQAKTRGYGDPPPSEAILAWLTRMLMQRGADVRLLAAPPEVIEAELPDPE